MNKIIIEFLIIAVYSSLPVLFGNQCFAEIPKNFIVSRIQDATVQQIFMQSNNIHTVFSSDGIFNSDKVVSPGAGMMIADCQMRYTFDYASGLWIGAKVVLGGNQKELRTAVAAYNSHFTPGNIPIVGLPTPPSVCTDPQWRPYFVNLVDSTLVNGGVRVRCAGGVFYTFNYDPWSAWPINQGAPYVEVNGIAGYQPGWNADRPGIGHSTSRLRNYHGLCIWITLIARITFMQVKSLFPAERCLLV